MASQTSIEKLLTVINSCVSTPVVQLIKNDKWGEIDFTKIEAELNRLFFMMNAIKGLPLDIIPENDINQIASSANEVDNTIARIKNFTITGQASPTSERDNIQNSLKGQIDSFIKFAHGWIPYLAYQKGDVQRNIDALNNAVAEAMRIVDDEKTQLQEKHKAMNEILTAAREASATVGVATFTVDFSGEAGKLDETATKWLISTAVLGSVSLLGAIGFLFISIFVPVNSIIELIQLTTTKLIILGTLITATIWCGKIYKANKHLATINKHRANALKTFQAFTKAASSDQYRDAVLMETTKSIFALNSTGYLDGEQSQLDSGLKVVEVLKNVNAIAASGKS